MNHENNSYPGSEVMNRPNLNLHKKSFEKIMELDDEGSQMRDDEFCIFEPKIILREENSLNDNDHNHIDSNVNYHSSKSEETIELLNHAVNRHNVKMIDDKSWNEFEENEELKVNHRIHVLPPECISGYQTEPDSGDEDSHRIPYHLPSLKNTKYNKAEEECTNEIRINNNNKNTKERERKKRKCSQNEWKKRDIDALFPKFLFNSQRLKELEAKKLGPVQLFELFFDKDLVGLIVKETNRNAFHKLIDLQLTTDEIKFILGFFLLSGYVPYPRRQMFWESSSDSYHHLVANGIMTENRFETILSHLHFAHNHYLDTKDKFAKVRPLFDLMNRNFQLNAPIEEFYSFGDTFSEYYGHQRGRYSDGKQFGFKLWCGTTSKGYLVWFDPDQGDQGQYISNDPELGVEENLVKKFACILLDQDRQPYHLCLADNLASLKLLSTLRDKGIKATGSLNPTAFAIAYPDIFQENKAQQIGSFDYRVDELEEIILCRQIQANTITLCSNAVGIESFKSSNILRSPIQNPVKSVPKIVSINREHSNGVKLFENNINKYRINILGRKWYISLFTFVIDAAINNAWHLYRLCNNDSSIDFLDFRRRVTRFYLEKYSKCPKIIDKSDVVDPSVVTDIRYDLVGHWVVPQDKQTRCVYCHQKTTTRCEKCQKGLHVKCFKLYHT